MNIPTTHRLGRLVASGLVGLFGGVFLIGSLTRPNVVVFAGGMCLLAGAWTIGRASSGRRLLENESLESMRKIARPILGGVALVAVGFGLFALGVLIGPIGSP